MALLRRVIGTRFVVGRNKVITYNLLHCPGIINMSVLWILCKLLNSDRRGR